MKELTNQVAKLATDNKEKSEQLMEMRARVEDKFKALAEAQTKADERAAQADVRAASMNAHIEALLIGMQKTQEMSQRMLETKGVTIVETQPKASPRR